MRENLIKLHEPVSATTCPFEAVHALKSLLCETHTHHLGRIPSGQDYLDALVGLPAHWLVPLALELSWVGMDTSHAVVDAEGRLTGERVWLEDPVEDDVRPGEFSLVPHPDYEEVLIGICADGDVVMYPSCAGHPGNIWQSFPFAIRRSGPEDGSDGSRSR